MSMGNHQTKVCWSANFALMKLGDGISCPHICIPIGNRNNVGLEHHKKIGLAHYIYAFIHGKGIQEANKHTNQYATWE